MSTQIGLFLQAWTLQEAGIPGVRVTAGTSGGMSLAMKAIPLQEHASSTVLAIAVPDPGKPTTTLASWDGGIPLCCSGMFPEPHQSS